MSEVLPEAQPEDGSFKALMELQEEVVSKVETVQEMAESLAAKVNKSISQTEKLMGPFDVEWTTQRAPELDLKKRKNLDVTDKVVSQAEKLFRNDIRNEYNWTHITQHKSNNILVRFTFTLKPKPSSSKAE